MRRLPICLSLAAMAVAPLDLTTHVAAQEIVLSIPNSVAIGLERPIIEPHLAVHPRNPEHLLAAVMLSVAADNYDELRARLACATLVSTDGGRAWERHDFPITSCYDPWVVLLPDGRAVFAALGVHAPFGEQQRLLIYNSRDGGRNWSGPIDLGTGHDHETVVADTSRAGEPWIYVVSSQQIRGEMARPRYTVFVARSRNGGVTFDAPSRIVPNNLVIKAETPVVLSDGTLVVSFTESGHARLSRIDRLGWVARSANGGWSFSTPLFVTEACGPPPTFSLSFLAVDASPGPFKDRLYFACNELGGKGIRITKSSDGGETWRDEVRIVDAVTADTVLRQIRGFAVNGKGVLGVLWTTRSGPDLRCYEVYFSASVDGGASFLSEKRVSNGRICPEEPANGRNINSWPTGGDYLGIGVSPDGAFHLMWTEASNGPFQLWTRATRIR